ncbi:MAG TPA: DoxX family protein [Chitinophagaceae bacterium]|nr:DoxX family protein [Chitinophagaceae bacterium]
MKRWLSIKYTDSSFNIALLLLRVVAGSAMAFGHGYDKLIHFSEKSAKFPDILHIGSVPAFSLLVFAEFFCALFVVIGLFTRLACVPIVIAMSIAFFHSHSGHLYSDGEMSGLFLTAFVAILLVGPGKISADSAIGK